MAALRSALATLSRGSCGSWAAAYMGGRRRGLELNQVVRHAPPPALPVAPLLHPVVTRKFKGYRHFSAGVKDSKYKSKAETSIWDRATYFKNRIANGMRLIITDLEVRSRVLFVCIVLGCGYHTSLCSRKPFGTMKMVSASSRTRLVGFTFVFAKVGHAFILICMVEMTRKRYAIRVIFMVCIALLSVCLAG